MNQEMPENTSINFSQITNIELLKNEYARLQNLISAQQATIQNQESELKIGKALTKKLRRELYLTHHISELVDRILSNLERINVEDHILFFNYLLNVIPEQMQCNIKYYIPKNGKRDMSETTSNLFVSLFENAYGLMQSKLDFGGEKSYSSFLINEAVTEEEAKKKEGLYITKIPPEFSKIILNFPLTKVTLA